MEYLLTVLGTNTHWSQKGSLATQKVLASVSCAETDVRN